MQKNKQTVCTAALIVINMGIFFLLSFLGNPENAVFMIKYGAMYPPLIFEDAQYYRLITCIFLHFGIDHLMNNMVMLGALGWNLEKEIGSFKFLLIYFVSGIGANLISLAMDFYTGNLAVSAGASGAIFGLLGALLWVVIRNRGKVGRLTGRGMLFMVLLSLYFGFTSTGVDNAAHVGGLICGFLTAVLLYLPAICHLQTGRNRTWTGILPQDRRGSRRNSHCCFHSAGIHYIYRYTSCLGTFLP